jgi:hypothetical protein
MVTALLIGLLFGFALQRGGFCGASLLSSVVLYKETKGLVGILAAIVVSMVGFAVLVQLGWVIANPNPVRLLSAVIGGLTFGTGMVLAGGCVTGTLFKTGEGRLTSMLALLGIGIGAPAVTDGFLKPVRRQLVVATKDIRWSAGVHDAVDLSYPVLAGMVGTLGLVAVLILGLAKRRKTEARSSFSMKTWLSKGWSPVTAGVVIGILGWLAYLSSSAAGRNYGLGGLGAVKGASSLLLTGEYGGSTWTIYLAGGIVVGSAVSARLRRTLKLRSADPTTLLVALLGGALVGAGAAIGRGCFIGNGVTGIALLSVHSATFACCTVGANWVTTILYLRGLK